MEIIEKVKIYHVSEKIREKSRKALKIYPQEFKINKYSLVCIPKENEFRDAANMILNSGTKIYGFEREEENILIRLKSLYNRMDIYKKNLEDAKELIDNLKNLT